MIRNIGLTRLATHLCLTGLMALTWPVAGVSLDTDRAEIQAFVNGLVTNYGFEHQYVLTVLNESRSQQRILDAISRPAEKPVEDKSDFQSIRDTLYRIHASKGQEANRLPTAVCTAGRNGYRLVWINLKFGIYICGNKSKHHLILLNTGHARGVKECCRSILGPCARSGSR